MQNVIVKEPSNGLILHYVSISLHALYNINDNVYADTTLVTNTRTHCKEMLEDRWMILILFW